MKKRSDPGYMLEQLLLGTLHQDWMCDFDSPHEAVEAWFRETGDWDDNNHALVADIDDLFAETSSAEERLKRLRGVYIGLSDLDVLLRAIRHRAVTGLAGKPEPIRAPE